MTGILVGLLLANAVFNAIVWPAFYRRVAADPRAHDDDDKATKFLVVHVVLIAVALTLAAASVIAAVAALLS